VAANEVNSALSLLCRGFAVIGRWTIRQIYDLLLSSCSCCYEVRIVVGVNFFFELADVARFAELAPAPHALW